MAPTMWSGSPNLNFQEDIQAALSRQQCYLHEACLAMLSQLWLSPAICRAGRVNPSRARKGVPEVCLLSSNQNVFCPEKTMWRGETMPDFSLFVSYILKGSTSSAPNELQMKSPTGPNSHWLHGMLWTGTKKESLIALSWKTYSHMAAPFVPNSPKAMELLPCYTCVRAIFQITAIKH